MFSVFSLSSILWNYKMFDFICFAWKKPIACLEMCRIEPQLTLSLSDCQTPATGCQSIRHWGSPSAAQPLAQGEGAFSGQGERRGQGRFLRICMLSMKK